MKAYYLVAVCIIIAAPCSMFSSELDSMVLSASNLFIHELYPLLAKEATSSLNAQQTTALEQEINAVKSRYHQVKMQINEIAKTNSNNAGILLAHIHGMLLNTNKNIRMPDCAFGLLEKVRYDQPIMTAIVITDTLKAASCTLSVKGELLSILWAICEANTTNKELTNIAAESLLDYVQNGERQWREYAAVALIGRGKQRGVDPEKGINIIQRWINAESDWNVKMHYYTIMHKANAWNSGMQRDVDQMISNPARPISERCREAAVLFEKGMIDSNSFTKVLEEDRTFRRAQAIQRQQAQSAAAQCTDEYMKAIY